MTGLRRMNRGIATARRTWAAIALTLPLLGASPAPGDDPWRVAVPFEFVFGDKTLPAGTYEFVAHRDDARVLLHGANGREVRNLVITTLALPPHSLSDHAHLVFDKVGVTYTLSEVWEPGTDGFLIHITRGKHEHRVVHGK